MSVKSAVGASTAVSVMAAMSVILALAAPSLARAASPEGQRQLQQMIEGARKEGELDLMVVSSQGDKGAKELTDAFKQRFALDIRINADLSGQESQQFNKASAETKAGIPSTLDLMQSEPPSVISLISDGGVEPIKNWEALLAEIAPEAYKAKDRVSPPGVAGQAFVWGTRVTALIYNSKLISEQDLPKTWREKGNPRFAGAYPVAPWLTIPLMCLLKYDKDECLEIVRSWGRNKKHVLSFTAATQRMMLGDVKFLFGNTENYFAEKARDANATIGVTFFDDLTPVREVFYVVRKGARHPNLAKLFALWVTGSEANRIFEKHTLTENLALGTGPVTQTSLQKFKERNIKPAAWFDSQKNLEKLLWLQSNDGKEYSRAMAVAQRDGK